MGEFQVQVTQFLRVYSATGGDVSAANEASGLSPRGGRFVLRNLAKILHDPLGNRYAVSDLPSGVSGIECAAGGLVSLYAVSRVHVVTRATVYGAWAVCFAAGSDLPEFTLAADPAFVKAKDLIAEHVRIGEESLRDGDCSAARWVAEALADRGKSDRMLSTYPKSVCNLTEGQILRLCDTLQLPDKGPTRAEVDIAKGQIDALLPRFSVFDLLKPVWLAFFTANKGAEFFQILSDLSRGDDEWLPEGLMEFATDSYLIS